MALDTFCGAVMLFGSGPRAKPAAHEADLFNEVVETVLRGLPNRTATVGQICAVVQHTRSMLDQLQLQPGDLLVESGQKSRTR